MKAVIYSLVDAAGVNTCQSMLERGFKEENRFNDLPVYRKEDIIITPIKEDIIYPKDLDALAAEYSLELIVMASRHQSASGKPTLTVHPTGNYGAAEYGGTPKTLQLTNANAMRNIYLQLLSETPKGYTVSLEATHHGPTDFRIPLLFAELGSSEKQWSDKDAGEFLADAIMNGLASKEKVEAVVGFGGNHYASKFSQMEEDIAFGHICPKYAVDLLDADLVKQMVKKTTDKPQQAVLDEKSLKGAQKSRIREYLREAGVEFQA